MNTVIRIVVGFIILFGMLMLKGVFENVLHVKWILLSLQIVLFIGLLIGLKLLAKKYTNTSNRIFEPQLIQKDTVVFVISATVFFAVYISAVLVYDSKDMTQWSRLLSLSVIANIMLVAYFEELFFRYYLFAAMLSSNVNICVTIIISSILFSVVHASQYNVLTLVAILMMGIVFSLLFLITKSLAAPIALHFVNNLFAEYYKLFGPTSQTTEEALSDICIFVATGIMLTVFAIRKKSFQNPISIFNR